MASTSTKRKVLIYAGLGADPYSLGMELTSMNKHIDSQHHEIRTITPEDIKKKEWTVDCDLIVFGGGFDLGFLSALGKDGAKVIREYVESGGSYLGLGAGGYFACDKIEFDKGGPNEVIGQRPLKFYTGTCIGPAFKGFAYGSATGAVAAYIQYIPPLRPIYGPGVPLLTDGGGYFEPDDGCTAEVLGGYFVLEDEPAAIVKCSVGNKGGRAILSGGQLEYCPELMDPRGATLNGYVLPSLVKFDKERQKLLITLLNDFGIKTNPIL